MEVLVNGVSIRVSIPSNAAVVQRVSEHMQRRIQEDDWRPYKSRQDAINAWKRLGGIRVDVLRALGLI